MHIYTYRVICSCQPKKFPPPPLKFFPVFVDFWGVFKLFKGILTCVLSLFSLFSSFPPFSFPFFKSSFKFFPVFQFGQKINGQNIYPCATFLRKVPSELTDISDISDISFKQTERVTCRGCFVPINDICMIFYLSVPVVSFLIKRLKD